VEPESEEVLMTGKTRIVAVLVLMTACGLLGLAQEVGVGAAAFLRRGVDARALGMGGAFVAVADGYSAIYWNPAGLARVLTPQLGGAYTDLFGASIHHNFVAGAIPFFVVENEQTPSLHIGLGAGYTGMTTEVRATDPNGQPVGVIQYAERLAAIGVGVYLPGLGCLGGAAKVYSFLAPKIGVGGKDATAFGFGFDLGFLAPLAHSLWLGISATDVGDTRIEWHNTPTEPTDLVMGKYTAGMAFALDGFIVAADYVFQPMADNVVRVGVEYSLEFLALRAGAVKRLHGPLSFTAGAGIRTDGLQIDVAWVQNSEIKAEGAQDTIVLSAYLAVNSF